MEWPSSTTNRLPVFEFPSSISFYADDNSSLKQILTLYNPYDFTVKFKVLSTAPSKYSVVDPEGSIRSRCYVDIVIRINDISPRNHNKSDEFRIWMYQQQPSSSSSRLTGLTSSMASSISSSITSAGGHPLTAPLTSGHRDVTATLYATKEGSKVSMETDFEMTSSMVATGSTGLDQHPIPGGNSRRRRDSSAMSNRQGNDGSPSLFVIVLSFACVTVLLLPNSDRFDTINDTITNNSSITNVISSYLPLPSTSMKLCAAYVLGVITKLILM